MARHPVGLGTHASRESGLIGPTAELSTGRTLEHALSRLDNRITRGLAVYASAWLAEMNDINCVVRAVYDHGGEWGLSAYLPADGQERERQRRCSALIDHLDAQEGAREAVVDHQRRRGRYFAERRAPARSSLAEART